MEVSYALAPSGDPPPCKRVLTRTLEDWDIVTAEAVLEGKECHPVGIVRSLQPMSVVIYGLPSGWCPKATRYSLPFLTHRARASSMDRRTWLGACSSHCWLSHSTHRGGWTPSGSLLSGWKTEVNLILFFFSGSPHQPCWQSEQCKRSADGIAGAT